METIKYDKTQLKEVVESIKKGKIIAFPTDTVFGLGVRYDDENALQHLKEAKIRPDSKPIPMMVSSLSQIEDIAYVDDKAKILIKYFMPGAFTIILKRKKNIPAYVSNGLDTIAIRMPDDEFVLSIMNTLEKPLLVSSANISAQKACQNSEDVWSQLEGRIDGIVLGKSKSEIASTIVDATSEEIKVVRVGVISEEDIRCKLKEE